jgi:hypothetical protein
MGFFKDFFKSNPLSLHDLLRLHAEDGLYKGEILNQLKDMVTFLAFPEAVTGPINFGDPTLQYVSFVSPDKRGFLVPIFMDPASLKMRSEKLFPHMIEFKAITKILENEFCLGIVFCSNYPDMVYTRQELSRVLAN